jgi:hypothetical protein
VESKERSRRINLGKLVELLLEEYRKRKKREELG